MKDVLVNETSLELVSYNGELVFCALSNHSCIYRCTHYNVAEGNIYRCRRHLYNTGIEDTCIIPVRSTGIVYDRRSYTKIVHTEGMYLVYIPKVCILYNSVAIIL